MCSFISTEVGEWRGGKKSAYSKDILLYMQFGIPAFPLSYLVQPLCGRRVVCNEIQLCKFYEKLNSCCFSLDSFKDDWSVALLACTHRRWELIHDLWHNFHLSKENSIQAEYQNDELTKHYVCPLLKVVCDLKVSLARAKYIYIFFLIIHKPFLSFYLLE